MIVRIVKRLLRPLAAVFYRVQLKQADGNLIVCVEPRWSWVPEIPEAAVAIPLGKLKQHR